MSDLLKLETVDADGAIRDAAEAAGLDRSQFLKRGVLAGGGLLAGGAMFTQYLSSAEATISSKKRSKKNDGKILNFALTLEFLESAFYDEALKNQAYGNNAQLKRFAETVAKHEAKHVLFLKGALGKAAIKKPTFDFKDATSVAMFPATSQLLEDTGVTAYLGQVANVFQGPVLTAAGTIATVEARHASWIRFINGGADAMTAESNLPAPANFDKPKSEHAIRVAVEGTKFVPGFKA